MENITRKTTAQSPSRFGMPACGHRWTSVQSSAPQLGIEGGVVSAVVRDRGAKLGVLAFAYVPGDNAWRPPTC